MASNYRRGRNKEYEVIYALEDLGYECLRAASSKGLYDVVGVRTDDVRLVQVKYTKKESFSEDENCALLRDLPVPPNVQKELWIYLYNKGLFEIRDLKDEKPDARTAKGKKQREKNRAAAREMKRLLKARRN